MCLAFEATGVEHVRGYMKAWCVTGFGSYGYVAAATRSQARIHVARDIYALGWVSAVRDGLIGLNVRRAPERDIEAAEKSRPCAL